MQQKIIDWFVNGRVGLSSKTLAAAVSGVVPKEVCYPHDPDDLNRCLLFLAAVPEARDHLDKVASLSEVWRALIDRFDEIEKCFLDEVGFNWSKAKSAPKTYALMKSIIKPAGGH
jgi:hypothetical protein